MLCNRLKNTSDVFNQISCSESLTVPSFQRALKHKSKKKDKDEKEDKVIPPLMAQLNSTTSKASVEGWVGVAHKDGFLVVDFDLATSFEGCMKCHISLLSSCEEDAEEHHSEDMVSPYNVTHSGFRTNSQGKKGFQDYVKDHNHKSIMNSPSNRFNFNRTCSRTHPIY